MAIQRTDPYPGMNFVVEIAGSSGHDAGAGILEVVFPEARIYTYEYRNGNALENAGRSLQTITRYGNLVLRRGAIGLLDWFHWWQQISDGVADRRTVRVTLLDEAHTQEVMSWRFLNARPVNYHVSHLYALGGEPLVETLELSFDRMEVE